MDSEERGLMTPGGPLSWNPKLPQSFRCHRFNQSECTKYTGDLPQITLCYKDGHYGSLPQWPSKQRAGVVRCKNNNARNLNHATEKITNNRCALQNNYDVHHRIMILPSLETWDTKPHWTTCLQKNGQCWVPQLPCSKCSQQGIKRQSQRQKRIEKIANWKRIIFF